MVFKFNTFQIQYILSYTMVYNVHSKFVHVLITIIIIFSIYLYVLFELFIMVHYDHELMVCLVAINVS